MDAMTKDLRQQWHDHYQQVKQAFLSQPSSVSHHIQHLTNYIDRTIVTVFSKQFNSKQQNSCAIIAVGGYGRVELFPHSDIDILVLHTTQSKHIETVITHFIQTLWDTGLAISHSTRTLSECLQQAKVDISVITNLMEARFIAGTHPLFAGLEQSIHTQAKWSNQDFLRARLKEQQQRHQKYTKTAYCIEPDVKYSPGGLRDLQTILWLAKQHYGIQDLSELVNLNILLPYEYQQLIKCQHFLWQIRFALHIHTGRQENRLLLEHQKQLALYFGFKDESNNIAVELFMKRYYQNIKTFNEINTLLLLLLQDRMNNKLNSIATSVSSSNHPYFIQHAETVSVIYSNCFLEHPDALLEIFVYMTQHPKVTQISAQTRRLIYQARHSINDEYRAHPKHRKLFITILTSHHTISKVLNLMHDLGVLGYYIPAFNNIIGQTQFDLYHLYPVDKHTLWVIKQLSQLAHHPDQQSFSLAHRIISQLKTPSCIYIAALFHDIGKGQGQDHSICGAQLVAEFCQAHELSQRDTTLIVWLVENHLLMSNVAQRQDISDPDILANFVSQVATLDKLDALYVFTIADIIATNENLWNGWRDSLLKRLYYAATTLLQKNQQMDRNTLLHHSKKLALDSLSKLKFNHKKIKDLWRLFEKNYFLNHAADTIAWHTELLLSIHNPLVYINLRQSPQNGNEIFIYCRQTKHLFATTATILDRLQINIINASISQTSHQYQIASYFVVDHKGQTIQDPQCLADIRIQLHDAIINKHYKPRCSNRRMIRQLQQFNIATNIQFSHDEKHHRTVLELITRDRPGLLATIAMIFMHHDIQLQTANIITLGERAEDRYFIVDSQQNPITDVMQQQQIHDDILLALKQ